MTGQGAGIKSFDTGNPHAHKEVGQAFAGAPAGRLLAALLDQKGAHMHLRGLHVLRVDAVIADKGVSHADHLSIIGGIGQHFLIAGHAGIENDFAAGFKFAGKGFALQGEAVFKSQYRFHISAPRGHSILAGFPHAHRYGAWQWPWPWPWPLPQWCSRRCRRSAPRV